MKQIPLTDKTLWLLWLAILPCSFNYTQQGISPDRQKPNIILILTDDQSYGYMGCTGNTLVQTPHLDQLASEGTLFTNAHVTSAICTPSRVSIFLSQFERKHGVNFNSGTSVAPEAWEQSYPVLLRKAGYYTGYVGKNHAPVGRGGYESGLMEAHFDYWYAAHGHLTFYPKSRHEIFKNAEADTQVEIIDEGLTDFLDGNEHRLEGALHFLEERPEDQPFMLSVCFNLPHSAGTGSMEQRPEDPEIYRSLYRDRDIPLPEYYVAKADIQEPKLPPDLLRAADRQPGYDFVDRPESLRERYIRQLQAMTGIDALVGRLQSRLVELGVDRNTVIIFTSDHGLFMGQHGLGGKALCYEQCTHVPMIVFNPVIPRENRIAKSDALVQTIDIAPTMLSLAGLSVPSGMQGKDLNGILTGGETAVREYLFTENLWSTPFGNPRCESIQDREWKYIRYYRNETISASELMQTARQLSINPNQLLYGVSDRDIARYRNYVEAPLRGEQPVYEELYHLPSDPGEATNRIGNAPKSLLDRLRTACDRALRDARGEGPPKVLRYTEESKLETVGPGKQ